MSPPEPEALAGTEAMRVLRLVDALPHLVGIADDAGAVVWMNRAGRGFVGATDDRLPDLVEIFGPDIVERYRGEIRPVLQRGEIWSGLLPVQRPDDPVATVDAVVVGEVSADGEDEWIAMLAVDVTAQRRREADLSHRASHDPLTGLPNRAMYDAKRAGGDCVRTSGTGGPDQWRFEDLGRRLRRALRAGRIGARFDPVVDVAGTAVRWFSVEPHWDRPGREPVPARHFLEDAAITGHADAVSWAASRRAVRTARELGVRVPVDIPVSGTQLRDPGFPARIGALRRIGPNVHVRLEVPESRLVELPAAVLGALDELGAGSTEVVLSGHGTAGAPLALLAELPLAAMKLAPSLTAALPATHHAVRLAVQLAAARGVPCVATGVDHPDQRAVLADLGVEAVQGAVTGGPWDAARLAADDEVTRPRP